MPDVLGSEAYASPQINIPPTFPFILKQYAKAAIRTQPYDLLRWSASYFRALAKGETPPIKDRLEYPPPNTPSGLSPGYLKVLIKQIGKGGTVTVDHLMERWNGICLAEEPLREMLVVGNFGATLDWLHFVAVAAGFLSNNLTQTMVLLCNVLTDEPEGGSALIPLHLFSNLYSFLAGLNCGDPQEADEEDDENNREYILADGYFKAKDDIRPDSFPVQRENIVGSSASSSSSFFKYDLSSISAHQLFFASQSPYLSPQISEVSCDNTSPAPTPQFTPPRTPPDATDNVSSATLTPENPTLEFESKDHEIRHGKSGEAVLETFYEAKREETPHSSQEALATDDSVEPKITAPEKDTNDQVDLISDPQGVEANRTPTPTSKLSGSQSPPSSAYAESTAGKSTSHAENGRGDVSENPSCIMTSAHASLSRTKIKAKEVAHSSHVPGIGPVVDPVQVQAVLKYLEGMALKQEGMVKPGNIRHYLCPPLEKVPASQKTKV